MNVFKYLAVLSRFYHLLVVVPHLCCVLNKLRWWWWWWWCWARDQGRLLVGTLPLTTLFTYSVAPVSPPSSVTEKRCKRFWQWVWSAVRNAGNKAHSTAGFLYFLRHNAAAILLIILRALLLRQNAALSDKNGNTKSTYLILYEHVKTAEQLSITQQCLVGGLA